MSELTIFNDDNADKVILNTNDYQLIKEQLDNLGVRFERWEVKDNLSKDASDDDILKIYSDDIDRLKAQGGYKSVDLVNIAPDNAAKNELRQKFLKEHTHSEDEVRFFVAGSGMFYLHVENKIYMLLCCVGDLIGVPANAPHWFDMGETPEFTCIRLFTSKDGWAADYTGDNVADKFPKFNKKAA